MKFYRDASVTLLHLVSWTIGRTLLTRIRTLSATDARIKEVILSRT